MATAIRMRRGGRTHSPYYRMVVIDSRHRDRGPEIEVLGIYHPCARPEPVSEINVQKALDWLKKGAQPSDTAKNLLSKLGVLKHFNDGTTPEAAVATLKGGVVEDKGYNAPPAPKEKPKTKVKAKVKAKSKVEAASEEAAEETPEAAPEAVATEAAPASEGDAAETEAAPAEDAEKTD